MARINNNFGGQSFYDHLSSGDKIDMNYLNIITLQKILSVIENPSSFIAAVNFYKSINIRQLLQNKIYKEKYNAMRLIINQQIDSLPPSSRNKAIADIEYKFQLAHLDLINEILSIKGVINHDNIIDEV